MPEALRVVARFADGVVLKGTTLDFNPTRTCFHLMPIDGRPSRRIDLATLKALCFVKALDGKRDRVKPRGFAAGTPATPQGRKVAVLFRDGELLCGYSFAYTPDRTGFFLLPADAGSNNLRIFVITAATTEIATGAAAEELTDRVLAAHHVPHGN